MKLLEEYAPGDRLLILAEGKLQEYLIVEGTGGLNYAINLSTNTIEYGGAFLFENLVLKRVSSDQVFAHDLEIGAEVHIIELRSTVHRYLGKGIVSCHTLDQSDPSAYWVVITEGDYKGLSYDGEMADVELYVEGSGYEEGL